MFFVFLPIVVVIFQGQDEADTPVMGAAANSGLIDYFAPRPAQEARRSLLKSRPCRAQLSPAGDSLLTC
jgi:hypothetical protein